LAILKTNWLVNRFLLADGFSINHKSTSPSSPWQGGLEVLIFEQEHINFQDEKFDKKNCWRTINFLCKSYKVGSEIIMKFQLKRTPKVRLPSPISLSTRSLNVLVSHFYYHQNWRWPCQFILKKTKFIQTNFILKILLMGKYQLRISYHLFRSKSLIFL